MDSCARCRLPVYAYDGTCRPLCRVHFLVWEGEATERAMIAAGHDPDDPDDACKAVKRPIPEGARDDQGRLLPIRERPPTGWAARGGSGAADAERAHYRTEWAKVLQGIEDAEAEVAAAKAERRTLLEVMRASGASTHDIAEVTGLTRQRISWYELGRSKTQGQKAL